MEIKKKIGKRLLSCRKHQNMSGVELAKMCGKPKQRISNWENGLRSPSLEDAVILGKIFNVSALYILCINDDDVSLTTKQGLEKQYFGFIPCEKVDKGMPHHSLLPLPPALEDSLTSDYFAYDVPDSSMQSTFEKGDVVVLKRNAAAQHLDYVLVKFQLSEEIVLRQLCVDNSSPSQPIRRLLAVNPDWPMIQLKSSESWEILGVHQNLMRVHY